ncbi:hypothetical protein [Devosia enhydra]|uniref:hypothetical protein n=1 Tax=Devosia enhydra TaxID=665118 RepID=UPI0011609229|nr:hypothetical protein [Devosia enhydra]
MQLLDLPDDAVSNALALAQIFLDQPVDCLESRSQLLDGLAALGERRDLRLPAAAAGQRSAVFLLREVLIV